MDADLPPPVESALVVHRHLEYEPLPVLLALMACDDVTPDGVFTAVARAELETAIADAHHRAGRVWDRGFVAFEGGA